MKEGHITLDTFQTRESSRLEYLSENIFNFTTYETEYAELFAQKALEVCSVISENSNFKYIDNPEGNLWYLLMVNMPFFIDKLDWGCSIRGAWWAEPSHKNNKIEFSSCGLFLDGKQIDETLEFTRDEWQEFIGVVITFGVMK
jgi:hypothetical protein